MPGPLDGIAVVDLTSYIAGSYAGMMLADMGARVTKVEALAGDSFRELPGFYGWNRGKRSIAVDLKTPAGCQIVEELAERSDVFRENMRPGVADRLGVGYERLHALNPRLVYSSVTAFGSTGPYADRPGFDPSLQAMSGAMALQGFGGPPQYLRIAVTDYYAASLAAQAILAALFVRERTGKGQRVETSLLHASIALQSGNFVDYKGKQHIFRDNPTYRLYRGRDGQWFFLACGNQTFWVKLCKALGLDDLADDPRFASWLLRLDNREALLPLLESRFASEPRDHWLGLLAKHDIPAAPVQTMLDFMNDPAVHNAMNETMRRELTECFTTLATDDGVRVVVVTGAGQRAFSAGADIREFVAPQVPTVFRESRKRVDFRQAMDRCPQPIIAAIRGFALGGGLELALACDIRLASDDAQLGLTEVNLAIIPGGGGTQRLPRLVGRGKALEMILTGTRISASEALAIGLVERVVPAAEVLAQAQTLARTLADKAPVALRYAKEAVVKGLELPLSDGIRLENDLATLLRTTDDRVEGARAFLEKRKPRFTGR